MINSNTYPATQAPNNMQFVQAQPVPGYPQMNPVPMNGYPQPMPAVTMPPSPQIEVSDDLKWVMKWRWVAILILVLDFLFTGVNYLIISLVCCILGCVYFCQYQAVLYIVYTIYRYSCNYFVIVKTIAYYAAGEEYLYSFYIYIVNTILNILETIYVTFYCVKVTKISKQYTSSQITMLSHGRWSLNKV